MYMQMVWMLTFGCVAVEGFFAWNFPAWRHFTRRLGKTGRVIDLGFSFALSWILGIIFDAPSGLVIFMSAILSTIISMPLYPLLDWYEEHMDEIRMHWIQFQKACAGFAMLVILVGRFFFLTLALPFKFMTWLDSRRSEATTRP